LASALRGVLSRGFDVVHSHISVVSPLAYAALVSARDLRMPSVASFHSVLRLKKHFVSAWASGGLFDRATVLAGVSQLVAEQLRTAVPSSETIVLPNGVDVTWWAAPTRASGNRTAKVVTAMRLHPKKRVQDAILAFSRAVLRTGATAELLVVGDGPERAGLEKLARECSEQSGAKIEFRGWLSREDLRDAYQRADAFLSATQREAFGIAALEASAAGLPVIAMQAAGSSEFLSHGRNALLCSNDADLTRSLGTWLGDATVRDRLKSFRPEIAKYDWPNVVQAHENAYRSAMMRRAAAEVG
jgi:glycosyltransferase involved in cell wall biosynthesis